MELHSMTERIVSGQNEPNPTPPNHMFNVSPPSTAPKIKRTQLTRIKSIQCIAQKDIYHISVPRKNTVPGGEHKQQPNYTTVGTRFSVCHNEAENKRVMRNTHLIRFLDEDPG